MDSPRRPILPYNPAMRISANVRPSWLVIPFVLGFFFLALDSMIDDSPTMDEQNHLARGLAFLRTGDPRLSLEHPPFINALSALPLFSLRDVRLPTDHPSWERAEGWYEFAELLLWEYNDDATRMLFLARLPVIFLTLGLAVISYQFAGRLWGRPSALPAFLLTLFEPNLMAHGRYTTTDLGATTMLFLATFLLWRLWQMDGRNSKRWVLAGIGMGLALGSKLSMAAFVPIWMIMALVPTNLVARQEPYLAAAGRRIYQLTTALVLSFVVLWATFGFQWGEFQFHSAGLRILNDAAGPMPTYWAGIEQIVGVTDAGRGNSFLLGEVSDEGFPSYFPVAFLAKTPLPILVLLPVAAVVLLGKRGTRRRALFLLLPATIYFILSVQSALNIGYRHLLPMLPFLLLLISGLGGNIGSTNLLQQGRWRLQSVNWGRTAKSGSLWLALGIGSLTLSDLWIHPHYLSYFNMAAGGAENGRQILVDSNIDWGQDLRRLKQWMDEQGVGEVNLGWFGSADPGYYGIRYRPLPGLGRDPFFPLWWDVPFDRTKPEPGVYAISVTNLWELPLSEDERTVYGWFRDNEPDETVGYSILIYRIP